MRNYKFGETLTIYELMTGEQLKKKIREAGFTLQRVATIMGYENRQRFYSLLKYENVKSGLIEDVARATGKPVSWFYGEEPVQVAAPAKRPYKRKENTTGVPEDWQLFVDATLLRLVKETNRLSKEVSMLTKK